jgi:Phosphodiester glycosidase
MQTSVTATFRVLLVFVALAVGIVVGVDADNITMTATDVLASDLDPNQTLVAGTTVMGQLWTPAAKTLGQLDIDLSIGHHTQQCVSKTTTCSTASTGFGSDDVWPISTSNTDIFHTKSWREKGGHYSFMVNGTYFYRNCTSQTPYDQADCESTAGPIISGGRQIIPATQHLAPDDPQPLDVLMFSKGTAALVTGAAFPNTSQRGVKTAIGGNILISGGAYNSNCDTLCHQAGMTEPRTVIGFDGLTSTSHIYFLVIQPGRCLPLRRCIALRGATSQQTATYLSGKGITQAFMLDGGGSSSYVYLGGTTPVLSIPGDSTTRTDPPNPVYRPITTVIGIR